MDQPQPTPVASSRRSASGRPGFRSPVLVAARECAVVVVAALVLSLLVKTFLVQAFYIPSVSMESTLLVNDRVLVSQLTPGVFALQRGDVVVFADDDGWLQPGAAEQRHGVATVVADGLRFVGVLPQDGQEHLVKRVIGLPGDHVVCCDADGRTTVNGTALDERAYLRAGSAPSELPFDVTVPAGRLWVEGDNRQNSQDSRRHRALAGGGTVAESSVVGRAVVTVWPLNRLGWLGDHHEVFRSVPEPD